MSYTPNPEKVTYFAMTDIRAQRKAFGIKQKDRDRHMYVIGKTGMGKSTLLENLAIQDIQNGEGICFIDPHGSTAEKLLDFVPQNRINDVMYFAPFDVGYPIAFNVMEDVGYDKRHLVASGLMSAFHRIWGPETWSARMEYILQNCLLALLETPDTTLMDVNRLLSDNKFRIKVVKNITDPIVRRYWEIEFAQYTDRYKQEAVPAIQNKIGQFVSNPLMRNIIAQPKSSFDIREMMDSRKIVIVNLSKGRIGEMNADLLGSLLVVKIYLAAMSRAELRKKDIEALPKNFLYIDEFQSVVNDSFANILSEARKYGLCMTIAHQYVEQMPEEVSAAVFGNVGTTITFRIGPNDAETLEKIFDPTFTAQDIVGLGFAQIYLSLMIDGVGSRPFSAQTLGPIEEPEVSYREEILAASRARYASLRKDVEKMVADKERGLSSEFQGNGSSGGSARQSDGGGGASRRDFGGRGDGGDRGDRPPRRDDAPRRDAAPRSDAPRRDSGDRGSRADRGGSRSDRGERRDTSDRQPRRDDRRDTPRVEPRTEARSDVRAEASQQNLGGFRSVDSTADVPRDIPRPFITSDTPVGPIVKDGGMPLARKKADESAVDRAGAMRSDVPLAADKPLEKTRDLLKEALEKFAAKEREREARNPAKSSTPAAQPAAVSPAPRAQPSSQPLPAPQAPTPVVQKVSATPEAPMSQPAPQPPQPALSQKSAEEIELEALRALLQDDE